MRDLKRALVVEPDRVFAKHLDKALRDAGAIDVATCGTVSQALVELNTPFELLVCSVMVANEACIPLLMRVKDLKHRPHVVVTSDDASRTTVFRVAKLPWVSAYLEKPFSSAGLRRYLDSVTFTPSCSSGCEVVQIAGPPPFTDLNALHHFYEPILEQYRFRYRLTSSEIDILRNAVAGVSRNDMAEFRCTTINTVKTQIRSLLRKCDAERLSSLLGRIQREARTHLREVKPSKDRDVELLRPAVRHG